MASGDVPNIFANLSNVQTIPIEIKNVTGITNTTIYFYKIGRLVIGYVAITATSNVSAGSIIELPNSLKPYNQFWFPAIDPNTKNFLGTIGVAGDNLSVGYTNLLAGTVRCTIIYPALNV